MGQADAISAMTGRLGKIRGVNVKLAINKLQPRALTEKE
ncbi:hypothetical protein [Tepidibacillus sp. HK-1]